MSLLTRSISASLATSLSVSLALPVAVFSAPAMAASAVVAVATTGEEPTVESLYVEGQALSDEKKFVEAGRKWGEALDLLGEDPANKDTRAQILLAALHAYMEAWVSTRKPEHLREAAQLLDRYAKSLEVAYPQSWSLSDAVAEMKDKLDQELEAIPSEETAVAEAQAPAEKEDAAQPDVPAEQDQPATNSGVPTSTGQGLIVGGAISTALGLGAASLIVVGTLGGKAANEIVADPNASAEDKAEADSDGGNANTMAIAGAVAAPILIGTGIVLMALGLKRRSAAVAVAPSFAPGYAGVGIVGRF